MSTIRTDVDDRVAVITLDDPDRRNALTTQMVTEIVAAFDDLEHNDECRAVIITGAPPAFCAGADLGHLSGAGEASLRDIYRGFLRVAESPLPTIAAVNGAAVGAGVNMALCCDVILVAESARLETRFLKLGLHPGGGHTWMMRRLVGPQTTAALVLFNDVIDGREAERLGFAYRCHPDNELLLAARALAARAAKADPGLLRRVKESIRAMAEVDTHDEAVELELEAQVWSLNQPWFLAALEQTRRQISSR
ncbi:MAG: enoyl-CoA hydratase [Acidimicrobiales bacterium]|nr:enoyl-CoA hydratase [Acidimicrobiales bacterium]